MIQSTYRYKCKNKAMFVPDSIHKIFHLYVGKKFSSNGRFLFVQWFRAKNNRMQKDECLSQIWNETKGEVTQDTWSDWEKLYSKIGKTRNTKNILGWTCLKYVAVFLVSLFISSLIYREKVQLSPEMAEVFVPVGERIEMVLPDSSRVWINSGSLLVYPVNFKGFDSRMVYLIGEASFQVKKDIEKPFIVHTSSMDVQALGTIFTVKSYKEDVDASAILEEGCIKVDLHNEAKNTYILNPGEQLVYSQVNNTISRKQIDFSVLKKIRDGYLVFEKTSWKQIVSALERKYGVTFQYDISRFNGTYNVKFAPDETIYGVMDILQCLIGFEYNICDKYIIVK